ncbi:unnamed protein product, partial [Phaeothamnion confervicola]
TGGANLGILPGAVALLTRVACTATGAQFLVDRRLVAGLARAPWLRVAVGHRPYGGSSGSGSGVRGSSGPRGSRGGGADPAILDAVRDMMWLPVLRLLQALLSSLPLHGGLAKQAMEFAAAHGKGFSEPLKLRSPLPSLEGLRLTAAATAVLAAVAAHPQVWGVGGEKEEGAVAEKSTERIVALLGTFGARPLPQSTSVASAAAAAPDYSRNGGGGGIFNGNSYTGNGNGDFGNGGGGGRGMSSWWEDVVPRTEAEADATAVRRAPPPGVVAGAVGGGDSGAVTVAAASAWSTFDAEKLEVAQQILCTAATFVRRQASARNGAVLEDGVWAVAEALRACVAAVDAVLERTAAAGAAANGGSGAGSDNWGSASAAALAATNGNGYLLGSLTFVVENLAAAAYEIVSVAADGLERARRKAADADAAAAREGFLDAGGGVAYNDDVRSAAEQLAEVQRLLTPGLRLLAGKSGAEPGAAGRFANVAAKRALDRLAAPPPGLTPSRPVLLYSGDFSR